MTENKAIKHLQSYAEVVDNMIKYCKDFEPKADITGYLEKKTVFAMAISAIKEVQQYREIGAVEECREAVEKQKAKKPDIYTDTRNMVDLHGNVYAEQANVYLCPTCESFIGYVGNISFIIALYADRRLMKIWREWKNDIYHTVQQRRNSND